MAAERPWPAESTWVHRPGLRVVLAICGLFFVIGVGLFPVTAEIPPGRFDAQGPVAPLVTALARFGLPVGFAALGGLGFVAALRETLRDHTVRSAAGVLPEVPIEPVNDVRRLAHTRRTHRLVATPSGWSLAPRDGVVTRTQKATFAWCTFTFVSFNALVWLSGPEFRWAVALTAVSVPAVAAVAAILWWVMEEARAALRRLDVCDDGTFRLDGGEPRPVADIAAVQLGPLRIKVGPAPAGRRGHGSDGDAIELNLVLRTGDGLVRETLALSVGDFRGTTRLAEAIADRLGVPLLNHATAAHWEAERERAKDRPWTHRGCVP